MAKHRVYGVGLIIRGKKRAFRYPFATYKEAKYTKKLFEKHYKKHKSQRVKDISVFQEFI